MLSACLENASPLPILWQTVNNCWGFNCSWITVLSAVCECILNCTEDKNIFTVNDIRFCPYSNELVTEIFNKPDIQKAQNEYDKFFAQPLKVLAYCGLLQENKKGRTNEYTIIHKDFLEYISLRDRNAFYFLSF